MTAEELEDCRRWVCWREHLFYGQHFAANYRYRDPLHLLAIYGGVFVWARWRERLTARN